MTFAELVQEVADRGFNYVKTARAERYINRSYQRICSRRLWPFLEESSSGTSPLTLTNIRKVLSVVDTTQDEDLDYIDRRRLVDFDPDLSAEGNPQWWYMEGTGSLRVYPSSSNSITVRYVKKPADMSGSDEPLIPEEFHELIVDGAVVYCLRDDDEYLEARELRADMEADLAEMAHALLNRNQQKPQVVKRTGRVSDYL